MRDIPVAPRYQYPPAYGEVLPLANYAPWQADEAFRRVYDEISHATQVDISRCYELWTLIPQTAQLPGAILEVGVWRGGTGALLAARAETTTSPGAAGQATVYLADTFQGVVKAGPKDDYYRGGEHADASAAQVAELLTGLQIRNARILEGVFPEETAAQIAEEAIRFCHIDVDVYQSARDTLEWVWPRMAVGGVVVYDDYGFYGCEGVTALGNEDFDRPDRIMIHNLNGHGILVKTARG